MQVNNSYSTSYENSELNLKIGNSDIYVNGRQDYNIKYRYTILDTKNEFYFNIIGTEWPVKINNAKFTVTMPKDFDFNKAGLSIGEYGTAGFKDNAFYQKKGNSIYGEITKPLAPYNGITLRIKVPENYFTNGENIKKLRKIALGIILFSTLITFSLWFKYGKENHITPVVTFYPPENINSLEAELVYKENATSYGLVALLVELAGKGYIKIETIKDSKDFAITKIKEYDGENSVEKKFLETIFANNISVTTTKKLQTSTTFYQECPIILGLCVAKWTNFFKNNLLSNLITFLCIIISAFLTLSSLFSYDLTPLLTPAASFVVLGLFLFSFSGGNLGIIFFSGIFNLIALFIIISESGFQIDSAQLPIVFTGLICITISSICLKNNTKKNKHGQEIMSQLLGLKKFIEVAEKRRLEALVEEDPNYFYNILPYAYILGVSKKWIEKLENIIPINPDLYNYDGFNKFTDEMYNATIPTTANGGIREGSSPSSSSGGGGYSGGGHGGGGGRSW